MACQSKHIFDSIGRGVVDLRRFPEKFLSLPLLYTLSWCFQGFLYSNIFSVLLRCKLMFLSSVSGRAGASEDNCRAHLLKTLW